MNIRTLVLAIAVIFTLYAGGCFDRAAANSSTTTPAFDSRACYADAQAQLSPQWAGANRFQRGIAILQVISTCEGGAQ